MQSMWAIGDTFGAGTHGFVIITTIITVGTYAAVFSLLHPSAFKDGFESLRKHFQVKISPNIEGERAEITQSSTNGICQRQRERGEHYCR
jgi:hypothetical protein